MTLFDFVARSIAAGAKLHEYEWTEHPVDLAARQKKHEVQLRVTLDFSHLHQSKKSRTMAQVQKDLSGLNEAYLSEIAHDFSTTTDGKVSLRFRALKQNEDQLDNECYFILQNHYSGRERTKG